MLNDEDQASIPTKHLASLAFCAVKLVVLLSEILVTLSSSCRVYMYLDSVEDQKCFIVKYSP